MVWRYDASACVEWTWDVSCLTWTFIRSSSVLVCSSSTLSDSIISAQLQQSEQEQPGVKQSVVLTAVVLAVFPAHTAVVILAFPVLIAVVAVISLGWAVFPFLLFLFVLPMTCVKMLSTAATPEPAISSDLVRFKEDIEVWCSFTVKFHDNSWLQPADYNHGLHNLSSVAFYIPWEWIPYLLLVGNQQLFHLGNSKCMLHCCQSSCCVVTVMTQLHAKWQLRCNARLR